MRTYPQLIFERKDGTRVEINNFVVEDNVFSRFETDVECTLVLVKRLGSSIEIGGYGDQNGMYLAAYYPKKRKRIEWTLWSILLLATVLAIMAVPSSSKSAQDALIPFGLTAWIIIIPWAVMLIRETMTLGTGWKIRRCLESLGYGESKNVRY